jgi:hypothetical protein
MNAANDVKVLALGPSALSLATYGRRLVKEAIKNGGCTLNTMTLQAAVNDGFVVGGYADALTIPVKDFSGHRETQSREEVRNWLLKNIDADGLPMNSFVGSWVDNGSIWFDFCNIYHDVNDALKAARDRKELAIFDLNAKESIFVD